MTLAEVAMGRFPFPPGGQALSVFELLDYIVREPPPVISTRDFSMEFADLVQRCLVKDPHARPTPNQLLAHPFVLRAGHEPVDLHSWIHSALRN
jgi:serine/threonine protein kinase